MEIHPEEEVTMEDNREQLRAMEACARGEDLSAKQPAVLMARGGGDDVTAAREVAGVDSCAIERAPEAMTRKPEPSPTREAAVAVEEFDAPQPPALVVLPGGKSVTAAAEAAGGEDCESGRRQELITEDTPEPSPAVKASAAVKFSPKQRLALEALSRGASVAAAAVAAGVHRSSVHRWLSEPAFVLERDRLVQEREDQLRAKRVFLGDLALEKLEELLSDESEPNRVAVLRLACKIAGLA